MPPQSALAKSPVLWLSDRALATRKLDTQLGEKARGQRDGCEFYLLC
jgi:hypothetical protein